METQELIKKVESIETPTEMRAYIRMLHNDEGMEKGEIEQLFNPITRPMEFNDDTVSAEKIVMVGRALKAVKFRKSIHSVDRWFKTDMTVDKAKDIIARVRAGEVVAMDTRDFSQECFQIEFHHNSPLTARRNILSLSTDETFKNPYKEGISFERAAGYKHWLFMHPMRTNLFSKMTHKIIIDNKSDYPNCGQWIIDNFVGKPERVLQEDDNPYNDI